MRRLLALLLSVALLWAATAAAVEPIGQQELSIIRIYRGGAGAHYAQVRLANGARVELKSRKALTTNAWLALATTYQAAIAAAPKPTSPLSDGLRALRDAIERGVDRAELLTRANQLLEMERDHR